MTIEELSNRYLQIVGGDTSLAIPCCANCKHYKPNGARNHRCINYFCDHPAEEYSLNSMLRTKPDDFCSRFEEHKNETP